MTAFNAHSTRFRIERPLGAGGFGVVYEATDLLRNNRVALKVIRTATPESLYRSETPLGSRPCSCQRFGPTSRHNFGTPRSV